MMIRESDLWETPTDLFNTLNKEFRFEYDICADSNNYKCENYGTDYMNDVDIKNYSSAFINPPYSNPLPFVKKAYEDSIYCKIVLLIKCDPSTRCWGVFWDYDLHKPKPGVEIRFLPKRLKFERDGVPSKNSANFPSVIVIFSRDNNLSK